MSDVQIEEYPGDERRQIPPYSVIYWSDDTVHVRFNNTEEGIAFYWDQDSLSWDAFLTYEQDYEQTSPKRIGGIWSLDSLHQYAIEDAYRIHILSQKNVVLFV